MADIQLIDIIDFLIIIAALVGSTIFLQNLASDQSLKQEAYAADIAIAVNNMLAEEGNLQTEIEVDKDYKISKTGNKITAEFENKKTISRIFNSLLGISNIKSYSHNFLEHDDYNIEIQQKENKITIIKSKK